MKGIFARSIAAGAFAALLMTNIQGALAQEQTMQLFKVITVKDEIVIGMSTADLKAIGATDAGTIARVLADKGELTVWQYAVSRGANGDLQEAPLRQVGILANASLRVEPYATTYKIAPHQ